MPTARTQTSSFKGVPYSAACIHKSFRILTVPTTPSTTATRSPFAHRTTDATEICRLLVFGSRFFDEFLVLLRFLKEVEQ